MWNDVINNKTLPCLFRWIDGILPPAQRCNSNYSWWQQTVTDWTQRSWWHLVTCSLNHECPGLQPMLTTSLLWTSVGQVILLSLLVPTPLHGDRVPSSLCFIQSITASGTVTDYIISGILFIVASDSFPVIYSPTQKKLHQDWWRRLFPWLSIIVLSMVLILGNYLSKKCHGYFLQSACVKKIHRADMKMVLYQDYLLCECLCNIYKVKFWFLGILLNTVI